MSRSGTLATPGSAMWAALLLAVLSLVSARAHADSLELPFVYVGSAYVLPDSSRAVNRGTNFEAGFGWQFKGSFSLEADATYTNFETGDDLGTDYYRSAFDARVTWQVPPLRVRPFGLYTSLGGGVVYNDVPYAKETRAGGFVLLAAGFYTRPIGAYGLRLRGEYRVTKDSYAHSATDQAFALNIIVPLRGR